jgi:protein ImuB
MAHVAVPWFVAIALPGWRRPHRALVRLAQWCHRFSPRVHLEAPDAGVLGGAPLVLLDVTGCLRVHGGAGRLARRIHRGLSRRGIDHAQAGAPGAGEAVARATALSVSGTLPEAAAGLPVESLRVPDAVCAALAELNIRSIGDLRAIARHALADRFGPPLLERLDMAEGRLPWPFRAVPPPEPCAGEFAFASPCAQREAVAIAFRDALAGLCDRLRAQGRGAASVHVRIDRARLPPVVGTVHLGTPTRDPRHLWAILWPRLERVHLGHHERGEGLERLVVTAIRRPRMSDATPFLGGGGDDGEPAAHAGRAVRELVDRLRARLGDDAAWLVAEGRDP